MDEDFQGMDFITELMAACCSSNLDHSENHNDLQMLNLKC